MVKQMENLNLSRIIERRLINTIISFVEGDEFFYSQGTKLFDLCTEYGLDSLDEVELIMAIEDEFDVVIEDDELPQLVTIADWVAHIAKLKGSNHG